MTSKISSEAILAGIREGDKRLLLYLCLLSKMGARRVRGFLEISMVSIRIDFCGDL